MALPSVRQMVVIAGCVLVLGWIALGQCVRKSDYALEGAKQNKNAASLAEYVDRGGSAAKARAALRPYHQAARARLTASGVAAGAPMLGLLDALAAAAENRVVIEVQSNVERDAFARVEAALGSPPTTYVAPAADNLGDPTYACGRGMTAAFAAALGNDAVVVTSSVLSSSPDRGRPHLTMRWKVSPGGGAYARANGRRLYPGIAVDGELSLRAGDRVLATVPFAATSPGEIQYTTYGLLPAADLLYPDWTTGDHDVFSGIVASTCELVGKTLVTRLTGVAPPPPPVSDEIARLQKWCNDEGDTKSCIVLGLRLRDGDGLPADVAAATKLLESACGDAFGLGKEACVPAAELAMAQPVAAGSPDSTASKARYFVMEGCRHHDAASCVMLGQISMTPPAGETAVAEYAARQAYLAWLHACDLGETTACHDAAGAIAPYSPLRAFLLAGRACRDGVTAACTTAKQHRAAAARERRVAGVTLTAADTGYDVRWAMMFENEEIDQIWVASRDPVAAVEDRLATPVAQGWVEVATVPTGDAAVPAGSRSLYRVGAPPQMQHDRCPPCPHGPILASMCTCLP